MWKNDCWFTVSKPIQFFFFLYPHVLDNCCYSFSLALIRANCVYSSLPLMYSDLIKKRAQEKERATIITLGRLHFLRNKEKHNTGKSACKDIITDKKRKGVFIYCCYFEILRLWGRIKDYNLRYELIHQLDLKYNYSSRNSCGF